MKKFFTQEIPLIYSCVIIGAIISILVGYTSFKVGEIHGRYGLEKELKTSTKNRQRKAANFRKNEANRIFNEIGDHYKRTNVSTLISIKTTETILKKRKQLISFIWGTPYLPLKKLPKINTAFYDKRYDVLYAKSLEKINHALIDMEFGLQSNVYHFIPKKKNGRLVIFHQGHGGDFIKNSALIDTLLANGYSVAAFCMPLIGLNNKPTIRDPRIGYLRITTHNHLKFLTPKRGHPVKYFLEPVVVFLNYASKKYKDISLIGISGGAWTGTLVSALDDRISMSVPVAGSYPIYLRSNSSRDWGDYEQTIPELYRVCNYLELYILGSFGKGRRQLQIINKYDACCFAGIKWKTYYNVLRKLSKDKDNMEWDLYMDDSHLDHIISNKARSMILAELNKSY